MSLLNRIGSAPSIRTAVAIALTGGVALVGLLRPDQVLVEHVVFEGNQRASDASLRHLADVHNGTTMLAVDLGRAEQGVAGHPWVRSVKAHRRLPDTVVLEIEEYEPVALLHRKDLYYVDENGVVFLRAHADDLDYPILTGIDADLERAHPELPGLVVRDAVWLLRELDRRGLVTRDKVSEVAFSRTSGFAVYLGQGAELRFASGGLDTQVDRLAVLETEGVDLGRRLLVDLGPAKVAIVRPLPRDAGGEG